MNKLTYLFILFLIPFISAGSLSMHFVDLTSMSSVGDVSVDVYDYDSNLLVSTYNSDVNGVLTIEDLEGEYTLRASKNGYSNVKITQVMDITDVDLGDQFMVPFSKVNVEVTNASGPVNAVVTIQETSELISDVFEGSTGIFEVPAGSYTIFVYAPNHVQKSFPIDLAPGEVANKIYIMDYSNETLLPVVVTVEVDLDKSSVNAGEEVIVSAKAIYNNGLEYDVTSSAQWNIPAVGEVYDNEIVTQKTGTYTITATFLGKTGSETLNVDNGKIESLTLTASKNSVKVKEKSIITSNLIDVYSNVFTSSDNVTCTTTCGTLNGNEFSSNSVCTATITCVYDLDNSINSTISVKVNAASSSDDNGGSSSSGSSSTTKTTTTTTTTTTTVKPVVEEEIEEELTTIKFVLPDDVLEGGSIEIVVTDLNDNPVEGIEVIIMGPDGEKNILISDSNGFMSFKTESFGNYFLYSEEYTIAGTRVIYVKSLMPDVSELNNTQVVLNPEPVIPQIRNVTETETADTRSSVFDILTSTISGEMSIVDALKSTVHLWILVAIILISAAVFFVVYTYVIGKSISDDEHSSSAQPDNVQMEKVSVPVSEPVVPPVVDTSVPESDLEQKLRKLKELKRNL